MSLRRMAVLVVLVLGATGLGTAQGAPQSGPYIVVLKDGVDSATVASKHKQKHGAEVSLVYKHALKGYAAKLSAGALGSLAADSDVLSISEDGIVEGFQVVHPPQRISNSPLRVDADESSARSGDGRGSVNINVAVLDDGMDATHPELNVAGSTSCVQGERTGKGRAPGWHGTAVGGFLAARDNDIGEVGIAPGARLWAVQVLGENGFGTNSEVICGLDWVAGTRRDSNPGNDIAVVNMSLGGSAGLDHGRCPASHNDALHLAVCSVIAAGVPIVVSAGNEGQDIEDVAPATYDDVITATSMADRDGQPGGLGGQFNCDPLSFDDTASYWSNYASSPEDRAHTVSAPGECIGGLYPIELGGYGVGSGTSFSAPVVTGVVALCIASGPCKQLTPAQIQTKIVGDATAYNTSRKGSAYGYQGDPLRPISGKYYGYLIRAAQY